MVIGFVISFYFFWQMSMESSTFIGFTDGASRHTQHSASTAWVIYTPMGQVLSSGGVCLWPSSNNVAEYSALLSFYGMTFYMAFSLLRYVLIRS